jgi:hypothetical protein
VDRRISHSQEAVREGDILPLRSIRIERDRHRLGLSLKQARDRGEIMGFRFGPDGEVTYVPEDIRAAFREEVNALLREARESREGGESEDVETEETASMSVPAIELNPPSFLSDDRDEDMPQTQMAAAFAALKLDQMSSDPPPEETKA